MQNLFARSQVCTLFIKRILQNVNSKHSKLPQSKKRAGQGNSAPSRQHSYSEKRANLVDKSSDLGSVSWLACKRSNACFDLSVRERPAETSWVLLLLDQQVKSTVLLFESMNTWRLGIFHKVSNEHRCEFQLIQLLLLRAKIWSIALWFSKKLPTYNMSPLYQR